MLAKRPVFVALSLLCLLVPGVGAAAQGLGSEGPVMDAVPTPPIAFIAITPCRLADTRGNGFTGPFGPPALIATTPRVFPVAGFCGVPPTAQAVSANVTVTNTAGLGFISVWPDGSPQPVPLVATLNYSAGQTIANAMIAPLGTTGGITIYPKVGLDLIIDVNGYFDTGAAGPTGPTGPAGPAGPQGVPGVTGATGPQGPQGVQGPQGATGPQGIQGLTGLTGATGPQGATGPAGPNIAFAGYNSSITNAPTAVNAFLSTTVSVTYAAGQKLHVTSNVSLGSNAVGGAGNLNIYVCYQSTVVGSPIVTVGAGIFGLTAAQGQRHTFGISGVITGIPAGTYLVGMCGSSTTFANWNNNEYSYTSVLLVP